MNIDSVTINYIYKIIFGELTKLEFESLTKSQKYAFIETIFKSRAHFLILDFFNKYSDLKKNTNIYEKAKKITGLLTIHTMVHHEESLRLNKIFKKNKLKFVFLKGMHLLNCHYSDLMQRPLRDIDILIQKSDINEAINVLLKNGYSFQKNIKDLHLGNFLNNSYDLPILVSASGAKLEVHFSIEKLAKNKDCIFTKDFLSDSKELNVGKHAFPTLSEEDLILHLIYHGLKKQGPDVGVIFIADIYKVISTNKFNHSLLIKKAKKYNMLAHLKIVVTLLCTKSDKKVFHDLNTKIFYDIDLNTLRSIEFLFVRNDIYPEEIKLFQFFKKLGFKTIYRYFDEGPVTTPNKNYKSYTIIILTYQILRFFRHFKILIFFLFKIIFSRSYRLQAFKLNKILLHINDF